jgi:phosphatidylglycerophosphatase C
MKKEIALFDFDGTVTHYDTLWKFLRFTIPPYKFWTAFFLHSPFFVYYVLRKTPGKGKEMLLSWFFKGMTRDQLENYGRIFCEKALPAMVYQDAMEKIRWHQQNGHHTVLVSASLDIWLTFWSKSQNMDLICTMYQYNDNKATGKFATANCNGKEKVRRIHKKYTLAEFEKIYAYGNSKGDLPMLDLAQEKHYRVFSKLP